MSLKLPAINIDTWADEDKEDEEEDSGGGAEELGTKGKQVAAAAIAPTPRGSAVLSGLRTRVHSPQQVSCTCLCKGLLVPCIVALGCMGMLYAQTKCLHVCQAL